MARPVFTFFVRILRRTLWVALLGALAAALAFQLRILADGGLRLPGFAINRLLARTAALGLSVHADEFWMDPRGRVLVRAPRVALAGATGDFLRADAVALQLRRRALLRGEIEITRVELTGLSLSLPAAQSPTGIDQALLEGGEFRLARPVARSAWLVEQASARVLGVPTTFDGVLPALPDHSDATPSGTVAKPGPRTEPGDAARAALVRLAGVYRRLADLPLDSVRFLRIDLGGEILAVSAEVPSLLVPDHPALPAGLAGSVLEQVGLVLSFPLADPAAAELWIDAKRLAAPPALGLSSGPVTVRIHVPEDGTLAADIAISGLVKSGLGLPPFPLLATARFDPRDSRLGAEFATRLADAPWSAAAQGDPVKRTGSVAASGELTPALLEVVRPLLPKMARPILAITDPVRLDLAADFTGGAMPDRITARGVAGRTLAHHVRFDRARGHLVFEPGKHRLIADDLLVVQDDSRAVGSYEMDSATLAFRFLVEGRIRPMAIKGWFSGWWDRLWADFAFGPVPPEAEVDVQGVWGMDNGTTVYVGANSGTMRLRELDFDTLTTRLQVNPGGSIDLLGFRATQADHVASGAFDRVLGPDGGDWRRIRFDVRSDFPLDALPRLFGKDGAEIAAPFALTESPRIHLVGEVHGPASDTPKRERYTLDLAADAPLRYHGFPLDHLSTRVERVDDEIRLHDLRAGFGDGLATGRAILSGPADARWLAFDVRLADARLDAVLARWREFQASRPDAKKDPGPAPADKALGGGVSLSLAATGPADDALGFAGKGSAWITGSELAQIRLLGGLSGILSEVGIGIGTMRLTDAEARFDLERDRLRFESLRLSGPSAVVESDGLYALPDGALDFTAKVRPFEQRTGIISSTVGLVLSPLTSVLEVKLGGTLDEPDWIFSYGPTQLFRRITGGRAKPPAP